MVTLLKTLTKTFGTYYTLKVYVYSKSQSVANNTTDVYYEAYVDIGSGWINASASRNWSGKIGDYSVSGTYAFGDIPKGSDEKKLLTSATKTITHGSDGKKTIDVSCTINVNLTLGGNTVSTVTASGPVDLPTIARASSISSANDVTVNGSNKSTVGISAKNSSYSHKVVWSIGDYSHEESVAAGTTSVSYAIPASWLNAIPNSKTGQLKITLKTYSGSTQIGSSATKNIAISVPDTSSYKPTYTAALSDAAGAYDKVGVYVKGKSKFKVDLTSISGKYSATIKEIKIIMCGTTYKPAAGSSASATTGVVNTVGDNTIEITVTDSRGYSTSKTLTATVAAYTNPYFEDLTISRYKKDDDGGYVKDDDGGYAKVEYTAAVAAIGSNAFVECVIKCVAAKPGETEETVTLTDSYGMVYVVADTELVYNFEIFISDKLSTVKYVKQLSTASTIMDVLKGGKGLCVGGVATKEGFEVLWPAYMPYKIQAGSVAITPEAGSPTKTSVVFPSPFPGCPSVVATADSRWPGAVSEVSVKDITETGCDIYINRSDATETSINWVAVLPDEAVNSGGSSGGSGGSSGTGGNTGGSGGTNLTWVIIDKDTDLSGISFKANSVYYFSKGTYSAGKISLSNIANVTFLLHEASINILSESFIDAVGCDDIKIFCGILSGSSKSPIKLTNCKRPNVGGVIVRNVGSESAEDTSGIQLLGDCTGFDIHNCYIHDITSGVISSDGFIHAYGVQVNRLASTNAYSKTGVIDKCCIENIAGTDSGSTKADGDGIFINNPPYLDDNGNVIWRDDINIKVDNCTINNCKKRGIKITSIGVKVKDTYVDGEMWYAGIDCQYGHADIDGCTVINRSDYNNSITSAIVSSEGGVRVRRSTIKAPYGKYTYHPGIRFNKRLPASVVPDTVQWDDIYIEDCYFDKVSRAVYGYVSDETAPVPAKGIHIKRCRIGDFNQARAIEISDTMFSSIESLEFTDFQFDYGANRTEVKEKNADFVYPIGTGLSPTINFELYSKYWTNEPMSGYDGLPTSPHTKIIYAGSGMGNIYYKEYTGHGSRIYGNRAPSTITSTLSKQLLYNSKVGDMYTDTTAGKVYICTAAGASNSIGTWTLLGG